MSENLTVEEKESLLEGMDYNKAITLDIDVLQELKAHLESQENIDRAKYSAITNAIAELESKVKTEAEAQERLSVQEEMKATFELPKDYNTLFDDHRANDEIKLLIGQIIDQTTEYYESVISEKDEENLTAIRKLRDTYEETIQSAQHERDQAKKEKEQAEAEANDLRNAVKSLNEEKSKLEEELSSLKQQLAQAELEKKDAEQKRDAAIREVESLKAQITELEQMTEKKTKPSGLKFTLQSGIEDTPIKTQRELVLERFGLLPPKIGGEPSGESFLDQTEDRTTNGMADEESSAIDTDDQVTREDFRNSSDDMGAGQTVVPESAAREGSATDHEEISAAAIEERFKAIEERLSVLESHPNIRLSA